MAGMSRKEISIVLKGLEAQGCELVPKKDGTVVRFPNGGHTSFHYSQSDTNDRKYSRALIRRNGLTWPLDRESTKKKEPTVARTIHPSRYAAVDATLAKREAAGNNTHPAPIVAKDSGVPVATVRKILERRGYLYNVQLGLWSKPADEPVSTEPKLVIPGYELPFIEEPDNLGNKEWHKFEIVPKAVDAEPSEVKAVVEEPEPVKTEREFIDTHDSWEVDINASIKDMTVRQLLAAYAAAGLEFELRVWRRG